MMINDIISHQSASNRCVRVYVLNMQYGFEKEQNRTDFYFNQFRKIDNSVVSF